MVKTKGPLLSLDAHGKLANILTYSSKKTGKQVRKFHYPKKKVTGAQWTQRHIIGMLTARWQVMTDEEKTPYLVSARIANPVITGFNYFIRVAQADLKTHLGLVLYYAMNETTGETIIDSSGQGYHGTLKPTYPANAPLRKPSLIKQYGNALEFDGENDYVKSANNWEPRVGNNIDFSISMLLKFTEPVTKTIGFLNKGFYSSYFGRGFAIAYAGGSSPKKILIILQAGLPYSYTWYMEYDLDDGVWYHLSVSFIRDGISKAYINGVQHPTTKDFSIPVNVDNDIGFVLGFFVEKTGYFGGVLDEVKMFNRALSAEETKKHYELLRCNKKRQPYIKH